MDLIDLLIFVGLISHSSRLYRIERTLRGTADG